MAVLSHFKFWTNNLIAYRIAKEVNGMACLSMSKATK